MSLNITQIVPVKKNITQIVLPFIIDFSGAKYKE